MDDEAFSVLVPMWPHVKKEKDTKLHLDVRRGQKNEEKKKTENNDILIFTMWFSTCVTSDAQGCTAEQA